MIYGSASTMAARVDPLFLFLAAFSIILSLVVLVLIIGFSIKYRRRAPNEIGAPVGGSLKLEVLWIVVPFLISMIMFVWGASIYVSMRQPPPGAMELSVVARQWMWKLQHPEGTMEINELHIPIGRDIKLIMTSQDVIHSFYVPAFRIKADVLPGRYTTVWFRGTATGRYHLFCAQYCGTNHAAMGGWVTVMEPTDYSNWLAGGSEQITPEAAGAALFEQFACVNCHVSSGQGRGPSLVGLYGSQVRLADQRSVLADENYLRESILNPSAKTVAGFGPDMPSFEGRLSEDQLLQLLAYIKSLGSARPSSRPAAVPATQPHEGKQ